MALDRMPGDSLSPELASFVDARNARTDAACDEAVAAGVIPDTQFYREQMRCGILGAEMASHEEVDREFWDRCASDGSASALDWFHDLSIRCGYVRAEREQLNVRWITPTTWGDLEMSINLAKPEKDPRDIAAAATVPDRGRDGGSADADMAIPKCQLCRENEGYPGRPASDPLGAHPSRQNLRIVDLDLEGQGWGLQFSPYAYYYQHCIAMANDHRPMAINRTTFRLLVDLVRKFPHYFFGSNADLPIVGGSILAHDHFQGGYHRFPMNDAPVVKTFEVSGFSQVSAGVVRWPLTVIRLSSDDTEALVDAASHILASWRDYSDPAVGVLAYTEEDGARVPHNTITPIVHQEEGTYILDLALRCNITTPEHPLGLFHPHEEYHHVKKENIGLIEVMGLAILPARLKSGLSDDVVVRKEQLREMGRVFGLVLENAGVFKWDDAGRAALDRFLLSL